jgi:hypothetical protein
MALITTKTTIELDQREITNILVCHFQDKGVLKDNIHSSNIYIREESGQIKCTIFE